MERSVLADGNERTINVTDLETKTTTLVTNDKLRVILSDATNAFLKPRGLLEGRKLFWIDQTGGVPIQSVNNWDPATRIVHFPLRRPPLLILPAPSSIG